MALDLGPGLPDSLFHGIHPDISTNWWSPWTYCPKIQQYWVPEGKVIALFIIPHFPKCSVTSNFLPYFLNGSSLPPHIFLKCPISPPLITFTAIFSSGFPFSFLSLDLNQHTYLDATSVLVLISEQKFKHWYWKLSTINRNCRTQDGKRVGDY